MLAVTFILFLLTILVATDDVAQQDHDDEDLLAGPISSPGVLPRIIATRA